MKKIFKFLLGIIGIAALGVAAVFYFTADMAQVADDFFHAVKSKDMTKAYTYLSEDFKAATPQNALEDFLARYGLTDFKNSDWQERSISGGRGVLTGSVTTGSGGVVPIKLNFAKGESGWKIYSIEKPPAGIQEQPPSRQVPTEEEQVKLVSACMHTFALSVNEKSMAQLHGHSSSLMQTQLSVEKLNEAFAAFFKLNSDLTLLDNLIPIFDEKATIDSDGVLLLKGHYATKPSQVFFQQKYVTENQEWRLLGLSVDIK